MLSEERTNLRNTLATLTHLSRYESLGAELEQILEPDGFEYKAVHSALKYIRMRIPTHKADEELILEGITLGEDVSRSYVERAQKKAEREKCLLEEAYRITDEGDIFERDHPFLMSNTMNVMSVLYAAGSILKFPFSRTEAYALWETAKDIYRLKKEQARHNKYMRELKNIGLLNAQKLEHLTAQNAQGLVQEGFSEEFADIFATEPCRVFCGIIHGIAQKYALCDEDFKLREGDHGILYEEPTE